MESDQNIWHSWADRLREWGVADWTALFMEGFGPLTVIGAQAIYITQPLIATFVRDEYIKAAAHLFEQPAKQQAFIRLLRKEPDSCYSQED